MTRKLLCLTLIALVAGCKKSSSGADAGTDAGTDAGPVVNVTITASAVDTTFVTREAFLAAGEMQISGEPFAQAMGRDLGNYSRDHVPSDIYFDNSPNASGPWIDITGFSTGVESYEYSKQPMNESAFEMGSGTSLVFGPLIADGGTAPMDTMAATIQHYAEGSHAEGRFAFPAGTYPANNLGGGNQNLLGTGTGAQNPLGWPGIWPTVHLFRSFDPTIHPTSDVNLGCAISSDDDPGGAGALGCADYECDATTMHLVNRETPSTDKTITPGSDGFAGWKYGLWVLNYLQVMHDSQENAVADVDAGDLGDVGSVGNQIVGDDGTGNATLEGTYLGSSDIEGFQAQMFIAEMDNRAQDWLMHLTTTDGATLSGFSSLGAAQSYGYTSPLQWFPGAISVTETADPGGSGFPVPAYALSSANSELMDWIGMGLGYAEFYSLTDLNNADVGGAQPAMVYFDGDPFLPGSGSADGSANFQQRALAMLRVSMINLDRLHTDPASGVLVDSVTMNGNVPTRGQTVATTSLAYSVIGLRTVLRSLSSQLELYSNNTTDTAVAATPLDSLSTNYPGATPTSFTERLALMLRTNGSVLYDHLTDDTGRAYSGWNVATNAVVDQSDTLDSHTAAIRGLFALYLATGDSRYHDRAIAVFNRMESVFYDPAARIYSVTAAPVDSVVYTPLRFALLQSALRDMYELVADRPGGEALEPLLEDRVGRLNKLVLNGWDDRNQNRQVEWPDECVRTTTQPDGGTLPRGGLQMAERTLTGETGSLEEHLDAGQARTETSDREHDCVPEVDDAQLPSALANSITFNIVRSTQ